MGLKPLQNFVFKQNSGFSSILIILIVVGIIGISGYFAYSFFLGDNTEPQSEENIEIVTDTKPESDIHEVEYVNPKFTNQEKEALESRFKSLIVGHSKKSENISKVQYIVNYIGKVNSGKYENFDRFLVAITILYNGGTSETLQYVYFTNNFENIISENETTDYGSYPVFDSKIEVISGKGNIYSNLPNSIKVNEFFSLQRSFSGENSIEKSTEFFLYIPHKNIEEFSISSTLREYKIAQMNTKDSIYFVYDQGAFVPYYLIPNFTENVKTNNVLFHDGPLDRIEFTFNEPLANDIKFRSFETNYHPCISCPLYPSNRNVYLSEDVLKLVTDKYGPEIYTLKDFKNQTIEREDVKQALSIYKDRRLQVEVEPIKEEEKRNQYIKDGGLIFIKNPLGGYLILTESEMTSAYGPGGYGGKPVLYLYPQTTSKISVKFILPMVFLNVVPNYKDSWEVIATPEGELKDLKPELTDCDKIKITKATLYSKKACENNNYPYLYWSGGVINQYQFPAQKDGFVVRKNDLESFFDEKLSYIGFNEKELSDFKEFWVPELKSKNFEYFIISFLQNEELSKLFPISVTPKPESQIRIFMDWNGYNSKPEINEQSLIRYNREGFTLVEWGGHKK